MTVKLLTKPHLRFLSLKGGCTDSSESTLVKIPHCWKSRVTAHIKCDFGASTQMDFFQIYDKNIVHVFKYQLLAFLTLQFFLPAEFFFLNRLNLTKTFRNT